jgi:putative hydrolase of the HAD superfamily
MLIKAVAFDVDGTLYPYSRLIGTSVALALQYPRFFGQFARVRIDVRRARPIEDLRRLQTELLADRLKMSVESADALIRKVIYGHLEERFRLVRPFRGVAAALSALREQELKLAVLSDFPVTRKLRYLGLDGLWDCELSSEETNYLKPNPEPFLALAGRLGLEPREILYVGDRYSYDVLGAHGVGMRTAHLSRRPAAGSVADLTFSSYASFARLVREIGRRQESGAAG